jgi:hypothetical protein
MARCNIDQAVFYCHGDGSILMMAAHVDNCTIVASSLELVIELKVKIGTWVEVTDLGELHWLLGIEVSCDRKSHTLCLSQHALICVQCL